MLLNPRFFDCGESALLVDFGRQYNAPVSHSILCLSERLGHAAPKGFKESVPALSTLTIFYDPLELPRDQLIAEIEAQCKTEYAMPARSRTWELPVSYGGEGGPDLAEVARRAGLTADAIINIHAGQAYYVYMLGFLPGFAYLGDLPQQLRLPRRKTPRARVPKGSVAIASDMTAVYPLESPGGWHILGYTPVNLWDMARSEEPLLRPGDLVRFMPVSQEKASALRRRVSEGWAPDPVEAP
jgi:KipI family sensor histidine kinase inhibitor